MVPADSRRISRAPRYSGSHYASDGFVYRPVTVCGASFQRLPLAIFLATSWSYNPVAASTATVWAPPRSLATTCGIMFYFLLLWVLRCFSSPRSPPPCGWQASSLPGCPIRTPPDQRSFAPPRGFSQLIASFVASESQGIHRLPLLTFSPPHLTCGLMYLKLALLDFFFYSFSLLLMSNMSKILFFSWRFRIRSGRTALSVHLLLYITRLVQAIPSLSLDLPSDHKTEPTLQKGGVPAAPSGTATLLRLSPSHQFYPRPILAVTDFRYPRLPWLDGRCVQGPGTYSPRHG